jgi:hypothetical protein
MGTFLIQNQLIQLYLVYLGALSLVFVCAYFRNPSADDGQPAPGVAEAEAAGAVTGSRSLPNRQVRLHAAEPPVEVAERPRLSSCPKVQVGVTSSVIQ